jgi:hypothetical protein
MPKGRTSAPVFVVVDDAWVQHPAVLELRAAGHRVLGLREWKYTTSFEPPDLWLLAAAHGWHEAMFEQFTRKSGELYRPFLDAAVKAGRQRRRAK